MRPAEAGPSGKAAPSSSRGVERGRFSTCANPGRLAMERIPTKNDDLSEWYNAVCYRAELVSQAPVRGSLVLRPYGYGLWERLQAELDRRFKETGHENAYFPLLIPESLFMKEAEHVEGFAPEVAWVTEAGKHGKLDQRLAIRPTSETIIGTLIRRYIQSHRDLPK